MAEDFCICLSQNREGLCLLSLSELGIGFEKKTE